MDRTERERVSSVKTVGRWPWKLASAKKRVAPYPSNRSVRKMDGADLRRDAPDAQRGRLARMWRRSVGVSRCGGACGADLGSSSMFRTIARRVRPGKEVMRSLDKREAG